MKWETYEQVARGLLEQFRTEFSLSAIEGKQTLRGEKTIWEIDAKGVREEDGATIVIECRRYTSSRDNQKALGGLAYTIKDTGAAGGIHVSPLGLQEGARRIALGENIIEVHLNADATPTEFQMKFLDELKLGFSDVVNMNMNETLHITMTDASGQVIKDEEIKLEGQ